MKEESINYKNSDMYSKGNFNEKLCHLNSYFYRCNDTIPMLKEKRLFINKEIIFFYDTSIERFCINYKYRGGIYKKTLKVIEKNNKLIFIPEQKKYISKEGEGFEEVCS